MEFINQIVALGGQYIPIILAFVGAFALIASKTPNKSDDRIIQVLLDIINFLGANFGKAKNDPNVK